VIVDRTAETKQQATNSGQKAVGKRSRSLYLVISKSRQTTLALTFCSTCNRSAACFGAFPIALHFDHFLQATSTIANNTVVITQAAGNFSRVEPLPREGFDVLGAISEEVNLARLDVNFASLVPLPNELHGILLLLVGLQQDVRRVHVQLMAGLVSAEGPSEGLWMFRLKGVLNGTTHDRRQDVGVPRGCCATTSSRRSDSEIALVAKALVDALSRQIR